MLCVLPLFPPPASLFICLCNLLNLRMSHILAFWALRPSVEPTFHAIQSKSLQFLTTANNT